jgi:hypothetical protein
MPIGTFLRDDANSPEHLPLLSLIGTLLDA